MKVLLYSNVFWPSLGGIEIVTDVLAQNLIKLGCECVVVTESPLTDQPELVRPYEIVRHPGWRQRLSLARQCSIVHANGASMAMFPYARCAGIPFVWTHNGYQVSCVDGLGWAYGRPAPMKPLESLRFHARERGWRFGLQAAVKLGLRRIVALNVDLNLAGSQWVAKRQPLPNQHVAYNPYPLERFRAVRVAESPKFDFMYVGRLVGEKGVDVLIRAFGLLLRDPTFKGTRLGIAGSGDMRHALEALAHETGVAAQIEFLGALVGEEVPQAMAQARFGVVPSTWEEPYGGVSLEWLAAGRSLIVSARGGHAECVADAGLQFDNGDAESLHSCMRRLLTDSVLREEQSRAPMFRIGAFDEMTLTSAYVRHYELALSARGRSFTPRRQ